MPVLSLICVSWGNGVSSEFSPSEILYAFSPPLETSYLLRGWMLWNFHLVHSVFSLCLNSCFRMVLLGLYILVHQWVPLLPFWLFLRMTVLAFLLCENKINLVANVFSWLFCYIYCPTSVAFWCRSDVPYLCYVRGPWSEFYRF